VVVLLHGRRRMDNVSVVFLNIQIINLGYFVSDTNCLYEMEVVDIKDFVFVCIQGWNSDASVC
jgi:hypothetical protein